MNSVNLNNMRKAMRIQIERSISEYNQLPNGTCFECAFMTRGESNVCSKFNAEPPQEFIDNPECEEWRFDGVPTVLGNATWEDFDNDIPFNEVA